MEPAIHTQGDNQILCRSRLRRETETLAWRQDNGKRNEENLTKINIMEKQVD